MRFAKYDVLRRHHCREIVSRTFRGFVCGAVLLAVMFTGPIAGYAASIVNVQVTESGETLGNEALEAHGSYLARLLKRGSFAKTVLVTPSCPSSNGNAGAYGASRDVIGFSLPGHRLANGLCAPLLI